MYHLNDFDKSWREKAINIVSMIMVWDHAALEDEIFYLQVLLQYYVFGDIIRGTAALLCKLTTFKAIRDICCK